jgi:RecB family exonuclease
VPPGVLDSHPPLAPIRRLSPSRYWSLTRCALRETWAAARQPPLLPVAPAARVGTAIHKLLADAAGGRELNTLETRWDELITEAESAMRASWLDRRFVPLRSSLPDLEVRRLRALERARSVLGTAKSYRGTAGESRKYGFEVWVESSDGLVAGFIDEVRPSPDGPILRDYKSGNLQAVMDASAHSGLEEYALQLRLYAALYAASTGTWPAKLALVALDGAEVDVPFTPSECEVLLQVATRALMDVNIAIGGSGPREATEAALASPGPDECRRCLYRPGCRPYQQAWGSSAELRAESSDLLGELREVTRLGNGKLLLTLSSPSLPEAQQVRGIASNVDVHPAAAELRPGCSVGLFGLRRPGQGTTWAQSAWTVVYLMPGDA